MTVIGLVIILPILAGFWIWLGREGADTGNRSFGQKATERRNELGWNQQNARAVASAQQKRKSAARASANIHRDRSKYAESNPRSGQYF